jgi:hypothetical protein
VTLISRSHRNRDSEERQECSRKVGSRMGSFCKQAEARARKPRGELDRDQEAGGSDRDERGSPLWRHPGEGYGVSWVRASATA